MPDPFSILFRSAPVLLSPEHDPMKFAVPGAPPHILIVEACDINRRLAHQWMARAGYRVEAVASGAEALRAFQRTSFDLVLMDCRLPGFPHFMATRLLRREEQRRTHADRTPIVGLTAFAPPGYAERCLRAGLDGCFVKPFNASLLHELTVRWLSGRPRAQA